MAEVLRLLDTNILLRHLLADHPDHSPRATAFLARIEAGEIRVRMAETVVFETVFTLQRTYKLSKERIRDLLVPIVMLPGIVLPGKQRLQKVFDLYVGYNVPFIDAYHAILMKHLKLPEIVSFDHDYDRLPGVQRREP